MNEKNEKPWEIAKEFYAVFFLSGIQIKLLLIFQGFFFILKNNNIVSLITPAQYYSLFYLSNLWFVCLFFICFKFSFNCFKITKKKCQNHLQTKNKKTGKNSSSYLLCFFVAFPVQLKKKKRKKNVIEM